ncbi:hypothetical protein HYU72_01155 [Candidatus Berkelbacteria bacterium]|nr:hypothetical protein [Candidatus Berkelbacteria bacterium]
MVFWLENRGLKSNGEDEAEERLDCRETARRPQRRQKSNGPRKGLMVPSGRVASASPANQGGLAGGSDGQRAQAGLAVGRMRTLKEKCQNKEGSKVFTGSPSD